MIILRFLACLQPTENAHFLISKFWIKPLTSNG
jgi:hypothetical protein